MALANWTNRISWPFVGTLCIASGAIGMAMGITLAAFGDIVAVVPPAAVSSAERMGQPLIDYQLEFFPALEAVENAVDVAKRQGIIRVDRERQQRLEQIWEVMAHHGATSEDIQAHIKRQLAEEMAAQEAR